MPKGFDSRFLDDWQYLTLDDLLDNQWHSQDHEWMYLRKGFHQCRWGWSFGQEIYLCTVAHLIQELEHQAEHVRDRQHRHHLVAWTVRNLLARKVHVSAQVLVCNHHTLRITCRTRGVVQQCQIIVIIRRIIHVFCAISLWIFLCKSSIDTFVCRLHLLVSHILERKIVHQYQCSQTWHILRINLLQHVRTRIKQFCLRVINQRLYTFACKIRQDTYCHCLVCLHCQECHTPVRAVASAQCNLITLFDTQQTESSVQTCNLRSQLTVCVRGCAVQIFHRQIRPLIRNRSLERI